MDEESPIVRVERRLDHLAEGVAEIRADVSSLKSDISGLKSDVSGLKSDVSGLKSDVSGLRVLYEHHDARFDQVFEVLVEHGRKLDDLASQRDDLKALKEFVKLVADNHEVRISQLEKR